jgi:hypothetical protein
VVVTTDAVGAKRVFQENKKGGVRTEMRFDATKNRQLATMEKTARHLQEANRPKPQRAGPRGAQNFQRPADGLEGAGDPEMGEPDEGDVFMTNDDSDMAMYLADELSGKDIATVRCEINGIATDCVLDTGAAVCCVGEIMAGT